VKPDHELDEDRCYFADHSHRRIRVRPACGEFERQGGDAVVVVKVIEGVRIRLPFTANPLICLKTLNEDEAALEALVASSPMAAVVAAALGGQPR
jgi:hypothetical protein